MTDDPVLHALLDMVEAVQKHGMIGPASKAYQAALAVIRERTGQNEQKPQKSKP